MDYSVQLWALLLKKGADHSRQVRTAVTIIAKQKNNTVSESRVKELLLCPLRERRLLERRVLESSVVERSVHCSISPWRQDKLGRSTDPPE